MVFLMPTPPSSLNGFRSAYFYMGTEYVGDTECSFLIGTPGTLSQLVASLATPVPSMQNLLMSVTTLSALANDAVNCFYLQQASVVPPLVALLKSHPLPEEVVYHACSVLAGIARNCTGLELQRCGAAAVLVAFLRGQLPLEPYPLETPPGSDLDDSECSDEEGTATQVCVSSRIAAKIAATLADMAFEQLGKRLVVQAGGVGPLLQLAGDSGPSVGCRTAALLALRRLAADEPCAQVMLKGGAKEKVVDIVRMSSSRECKECALSLLSSLEKQSVLSPMAEGA